VIARVERPKETHAEGARSTRFFGAKVATQPAFETKQHDEKVQRWGGRHCTRGQ
jgi:hypothetical protein